MIVPSLSVELIETLWNVNLNENTKQMTELIELIETLWNVNTDNLRAINGDGTN